MVRGCSARPLVALAGRCRGGDGRRDEGIGVSLAHGASPGRSVSGPASSRKRLRNVASCRNRAQSHVLSALVPCVLGWPGKPEGRVADPDGSRTRPSAAPSSPRNRLASSTPAPTRQTTRKSRLPQIRGTQNKLSKSWHGPLRHHAGRSVLGPSAAMPGSSRLKETPPHAPGPCVPRTEDAFANAGAVENLVNHGNRIVGVGNRGILPCRSPSTLRRRE